MADRVDDSVSCAVAARALANPRRTMPAAEPGDLYGARGDSTRLVIHPSRTEPVLDGANLRAFPIDWDDPGHLGWVRDE